MLRVVIADDELLLRAGLSRLLADAQIAAVAQLSDGRSLLDAVQVHRPDVAIVDVQLGDADGADDGDGVTDGRASDGCADLDGGLRAAIAVRRLGSAPACSPSPAGSRPITCSS